MNDTLINDTTDENRPRQMYALEETGFKEVPKKFRRFYRKWGGPGDELAPNLRVGNDFILYAAILLQPPWQLIGSSASRRAETVSVSGTAGPVEGWQVNLYRAPADVDPPRPAEPLTDERKGSLTLLALLGYLVVGNLLRLIG